MSDQQYNASGMCLMGEARPVAICVSSPVLLVNGVAQNVRLAPHAMPVVLPTESQITDALSRYVSGLIAGSELEIADGLLVPLQAGAVFADRLAKILREALPPLRSIPFDVIVPDGNVGDAVPPWVLAREQLLPGYLCVASTPIQIVRSVGETRCNYTLHPVSTSGISEAYPLNLAIALSEGEDSIALTEMCEQLQKDGRRLVVLTRARSNPPALQLLFRRWIASKGLNIQVEVLAWE